MINYTIRQAGGQNYIKQYIKDLDTLLKDVGLLRTVTAGQLDVNNIPDLDIDSIFAVNGSFWNFNTTKSAWHQPIEYGFNDALQASSPVIIKFEFFFFCPNYYTIPHPVTNRPYFGCKVTVSTSSNSQVIWQLLPFTASQSSSTNANTWPLSDIILVSSNRNSLICYNKDKGYLYLNYCPDARYNLIYGNPSTTGSHNQYPTNSCIHLLVERSRNVTGPTPDYIRVVSTAPQFSNGNASYGGGSFTSNPNKNIFYSYVITASPSFAVYESSQQFSVPLNADTYSKDGKHFIYMSTIYDVITQSPTSDPFVLIGSARLPSGTSTTTYDVNINSNETKTYLALSTTDNGGYPYNVNQCLLVYFDEN